MALSSDILGWFHSESAPDCHVVDRFASFYACECPLSYEPVRSDEMFGDVWLQEFSLHDIMTLGFTTREYQAMVRFWIACDGDDWLRSEGELDAMGMWLNDPRHHLNDNRVVDAILKARDSHHNTDEEPRLETLRSEDVSEDLILVKKIDDDRFQSFHKYQDKGIGLGRSLSFADEGIWNLTLRQVIQAGFCRADYEAALYMEIASNRKDWVRSEEELRVLKNARLEMHHQNNARAESVFSLRERKGHTGPIDGIYLHPSPVTSNFRSNDYYEDYSWSC